MRRSILTSAAAVAVILAASVAWSEDLGQGFIPGPVRDLIRRSQNQQGQLPNPPLRQPQQTGRQPRQTGPANPGVHDHDEHAHDEHGHYDYGLQTRYGSRSHLDALSADLKHRANALCWEMYENYKENPNWRDTYRAAYKLLQDAKEIYMLVYNNEYKKAGDPGVDRIAHDLADIDQLFHVVEEGVENWKPTRASPHGGANRGKLSTILEDLEETLHHLMADYGVTSSREHDHAHEHEHEQQHEAAPPVPPVITGGGQLQANDPMAVLPPLHGDFLGMVYQVANYLDWLVAARGGDLPRESQFLLAEGKTQLDTSCAICDAAPDLFGGAATSTQAQIRDVVGELEKFSDVLSKVLRHDKFLQVQQKLAAGAPLAQADGETRLTLLALLALQKKGMELATHAQEVQLGTFRPVDLGDAQGVAVGQQAPEIVAPTASWSIFKLSDYRGKRNVLLVFSAGDWCGFCQQHLQALTARAKDFKARDTEVVFLFREAGPHKDIGEAVAGVKGMADKTGAPFPLVVDFEQRQTAGYSPRIRNDDGAEGVQYTTYLIDKQGRVAQEFYGVRYIRPSADALLGAIDKLPR